MLPNLLSYLYFYVGIVTLFAMIFFRSRDRGFALNRRNASKKGVLALHDVPADRAIGCANCYDSLQKFGFDCDRRILQGCPTYVSPTYVDPTYIGSTYIGSTYICPTSIGNGHEA